MKSLALLVVLAGCEISLDKHVYLDAGDPSGRPCQTTMTSPCLAATTHADFAWIKQNIFDTNCFGSSCHDKRGLGKLDLSGALVTTAQAYTNLVGTGGSVKSMIDSTRTLVVPGSGPKSYLELMVQEIKPSAAEPPGNPPPSNIGYMPQAAGVLCCQKLDAIDRWITAGAMNN